MFLRTATCLRRILPAFRGPRLGRTSSSSGKGQGPEKVGADAVLPPEPNHCCMSGCPNCVWIKYAQELAEKFDNGDVIAKEKISEKVKDPALKAFLFTSLGLHETANKTKRT